MEKQRSIGHTQSPKWHVRRRQDKRQRGWSIILAAIAGILLALLGSSPPLAAQSLWQAGDPEAEQCYRKAMAPQATPTSPEYDWACGEYMRNRRGPLQPLFSEAEDLYYQALKKNDARPEDSASRTLRSQVHRSLTLLYERDGLPLFNRIDRGRPFVFLSTQNTVTRSLADLGDVDEVRAFTSEALFAASLERLNRALSQAELRGIIREKTQIDTFNRLRLRYHAFPVLDLFVQHRDIDDAQITKFRAPNRFNDVTFTLYGGAVEKTLALYPVFDVLLRGEVRHVHREGLIEFVPEATEDVLSVVGRAVFSRFIGPDKASLELTVVSDDIDQNIATPIKRRLFIVAPTFRYEIFRPLGGLFGDPAKLPIARRSEVFAGAALRQETFADVEVQEQDFFAGLALRNLRGFRDEQSFDITLQSTLLTAEREGRDAQGRAVEALAHRQYRTSVVLLYRLVDKEREIPEHQATIPPVAFLNLVLLGSHDLAVRGPRDFENLKLGGGLDAKFLLEALQGGTTFLASARYEFQRFYQLDRDAHLFFVKVSMGF